MNDRNNFTGQTVDSRTNNDNAPARYSAPSTDFKAILAGFANQYCIHCSGTGYIGRFKHVCAGRCFKCVPDKVLEQAEEEFNLSSGARTACDEMAEIYQAMCGGDGGDCAYLSDGMWLTPDGQIYDTADRIVSSRESFSSALRSAWWTA